MHGLAVETFMKYATLRSIESYLKRPGKEMRMNPVDLTNLREMTEGDVEMEKELFEEFFSSSEKCIASMRQGCIDGESPDFRAHAHALKGTSVNMGAAKLSELCKEAQEKSDVPKAEKENLLENIQSEYENVKLFLQNNGC